jgi:NADH-ubiquinone oxidoreductase chain 3
MNNFMLLIVLIPGLTGILLLVNLVLAPHSPYGDKKKVFECGYSSFLFQNRTQFYISFFIFALLFLLFDLEILLVYPYSVSSKNNNIYGLSIIVIFFLLLVLGFIFELGKGALNIPSKQSSNDKQNSSNLININNMNLTGKPDMTSIIVRREFLRFSTLHTTTKKGFES